MTVRPFGDVTTKDPEVIWKARRAFEKQSPVTFIVYDGNGKPLRTVVVKVAVLVKGDGDHWLIKTKAVG